MDDTDSERAAPGEQRRVGVKEIRQGPLRRRLLADRQRVAALAAEVGPEENPAIMVTPLASEEGAFRYEAVAGQGALAALAHLGREEVEVTVFSLPRGEALLLGLTGQDTERLSVVEQFEDAGVVLEAEQDLTRAQVAEAMGVDASRLSKNMRVLTTLPEASRAAIVEAFHYGSYPMPEVVLRRLGQMDGKVAGHAVELAIAHEMTDSQVAAMAKWFESGEDVASVRRKLADWLGPEASAGRIDPSLPGAEKLKDAPEAISVRRHGKEGVLIVEVPDDQVVDLALAMAGKMKAGAVSADERNALTSGGGDTEKASSAVRSGFGRGLVVGGGMAIVVCAAAAFGLWYSFFRPEEMAARGERADVLAQVKQSDPTSVPSPLASAVSPAGAAAPAGASVSAAPASVTTTAAPSK